MTSGNTYIYFYRRPLALLLALALLFCAAFVLPREARADASATITPQGVSLRDSSGDLQYSLDGGGAWTDYTGTLTLTGTANSPNALLRVESGGHVVALNGADLTCSGDLAAITKGTLSLSVNGGSISAGSLTATALTINGGTLNITGALSPTPKNSAGTSVYKTTLTLIGTGGAAEANAPVSTLVTSPAVAYDMTGVKTDANGKLYVYLPVGTKVLRAMAGGALYGNATGTDIITTTGGATGTLTKGAAPAITTTTTLPEGVVGVDYTGTLAATGDGTLTWAVSSGSLPAGITLNANGTFSGAPTAAGTSTAVIKAESNYGADSKSFTIAVHAPASITTTVLSDGVLNQPYTGTLRASGDTPITWSLTIGSLPPGLTLGTDGALSGTPTGAGGSYTFTVSAQNAYGSASTRQFTLQVNAPPVITDTALPSMIRSNGYTHQIAHTGYPAPTFTLSDGALPAGLTLSATGYLSGTPTAAGPYDFTVKAANAGGQAGKRFTGTVYEPVRITTTVLSDAAINTAYSATLTATGGGTITWSHTGTWPAWLTLSANGSLSGTPTVAGAHTLQISARSSSGSEENKTFTLFVNAPGQLIRATPASLAFGTATVGYTTRPAAKTVTVTNITNGQITLNNRPVLKGYTVTGTFPMTLAPRGSATFTVQPNAGLAVGSYAGQLVISNNVTGGPHASVGVSFTVEPKLAITTSGLFNGMCDQNYRQVLLASGAAPITWSVAGGRLPRGLMLTDTGILLGTPAESGTFSVVLRAANAAAAVTRTFTFTIYAGVPAPVYPSGYPTLPAAITAISLDPVAAITTAPVAGIPATDGAPGTVGLALLLLSLFMGAGYEESRSRKQRK